MSTSIPTVEPQTFRARSNVRASITAFLAIVRRDLLVMRRDALVYLVQMLLQPLFFLFIFGKVFASVGVSAAGFSTLLLPGIVALTLFVTTLQGPSIELARDLGFTREIEDRLLAPLPVALVAIEKILLSALRGVIAGALVLPLAAVILGSDLRVSTDHLGILVGLMILISLAGATLGFMLAVSAPLRLLPLLFGIVLTPITMTGCTFFTWSSLHTLKWFQVATLFNPMTYASEGLRYAMVPLIHGQAIDTLALGWVILALCGTFVTCLLAGIALFHRRVVS
jgi:ABC-2 type transport system permease protein